MRISSELTRKLIKKGYLTAADAPMFEYKFECKLSTVIVGIPFFILAILLTTFITACSFFWCFYYLRVRTGGYHARTVVGCLVFSLILEYGFLGFVYPLLTPCLSSIIFVISIPLILILAPYNHPNLHFSKDELKATRKIMQIHLMVLVFVFAFSYYCMFKNLLYGVTIGVAMAVFLLCLAYIFKNGSVEND